MKKGRKITWKKDKAFITVLSLAIVDLVALVSVASHGFAWFAEHTDTANVSPIHGYSTADYFNGGDGSKESPFQIAYPFQLYNFAWLQDLGYFNEMATDSKGISTGQIQQYYFKVVLPKENTTGKLDMSDYLNGLALPPIGNSTYPFVGSFDGNGVVIENLVISNKYSELFDPPTDKDGKSLESSDGTLKDSSFVGAFGVIGNADEKATSLAWDKNENIVKNAYFDSIDVHTASSKTLVGVVAGYAGGTMEKCGVHYSSIKVGGNVTNLDGYENVSKYSLLGEYNKTYQWTDAPGDVGYGNSLDLAEISARTSMLSTKDQFSKFEYLPLRGTGQKRSDAIKTPGGRTATYVGEQAAETNIGYITGSDVKISTDKTLPGNVVNDTFFSIKDSNGNFTGNQDEIYTTEIKKDDDIYLNTFGSEAFINKKPIPLIRLMSRLEDFSVDETARVTYIKDAWISSNHYDQIIIPARSIWVKPVLPGTMRFIIVSCDATHNILSLNKLVRQNPKDLTSRLTRTDAIPEQYLRLSYGGAVTKIDGKNVNSGEYSGKYFVYSIQYDVTEDEVAAGTEFVLNNQSKSNGAYFWYMDVGQNGSQADFQGNITNVDFLAKDSNGSLIGFDSKGYQASNVGFKILNASTGDNSFYFRRSATAGIYYYKEANGLTIEKTGKGSATLASSSSCESA